MDITVTETLRHDLTVSDSDFNLTLVSGPTGAASTVAGPKGDQGDQGDQGLTGPNNINHTTGSDGTAVILVSELSATTVSTDTVSTETVSATGNITGPKILASEEIGYSSGGEVAQETSATTGVTLDAPSGVISTYIPLALSAETSSTFTLSNTFIGVNDVVVVSLQQSNSSTGVLSVAVTDTAEGSCDITIFNHSNGSEVTAPVINFAVIKGQAPEGSSGSEGSTSSTSSSTSSS